MKKLLIFMFTIFFISLASAGIDEQGSGEQNQNFTINQMCGEATYITLSTIQYPDRTVQTINTNMTSVGGGSFQYNFTDTEQIGRYDVGCISDGCERTCTFFFLITPTGFTIDTSESLIYIVILVATFILFLSFLYPAIKLPYSHKTNKDGSITRLTKAKYLKLLSIWFAYGFLMWFLQTLNAISKSFIQLTYLSNFITNIFTYSQLFSVGITFLILIILFIEIWKDILLSQTIKRLGKAFLDERLQ